MNYDDERNIRGSTIAKLIAGGVVGIFALTIIFGSFYTIDQGDRGVILCNGAVCGEAGPGLHWKIPMVQSVHEMSMRSQLISWDGSKDESGAVYQISAYTKDKQVATVHLTVNWRMTNATRTYNDYKTVEQLGQQVVIPKTMEMFKNSFGRVDSTDAITQREKLNTEVLNNLRAAVAPYPAMVASVQITDISFSNAYDQAVAANMEAQVKVLKARADQQRNNIEADTKLYAAKAAADAVAYGGQKEADAIKAKGDALRSSPEVVALTTAQNWDGHLPTTMIPGGTLPFINTK